MNLNEQDRHLIHYLILLVGISVCAFLFVFFNHLVSTQIIVAAAGCLYYVLWGIIHHSVEGRLTTMITLEYVLIGSLVFLLFFSALYL